MPAPSKIHSKDAKPGDTTLVVRNIDITDENGVKVRTSMRLEPYVWDALNEIARREGRTPSEICDLISHGKPPGAMLTGAVRMFILSYFLHAATEDGHNRAGHGRGDRTLFDRIFGLLHEQAKLAGKGKRRKADGAAAPAGASRQPRRRGAQQAAPATDDGGSAGSAES